MAGPVAGDVAYLRARVEGLLLLRADFEDESGILTREAVLAVINGHLEDAQRLLVAALLQQ